MCELVGSRGFARALRRFVGPGRASWYQAKTDRTEQLLDILGGPSIDPVDVGGGMLRFDACYPHVCNVRASLFVTKTGEIRGAALLYPDCSGQCSGDEGLRLTILRDAGHPDVVPLARRWADDDIARANAQFHGRDETLQRTEIVDVPALH